MAKIFISYRRADSGATTGRIHDRLVQVYDQDSIFRDVDPGDIPAGYDFRGILREQAATCDVMLVIIGKTWLTIEENNQRRLDRPDDWVRIEVQTGLERSDHIPVIPVLVDGASMPHRDDLPEVLRSLAFKNAISVRADPDFDGDIKRLIEAINSALPSNLSGKRRAAPPRQRTLFRYFLIPLILIALVIGLVRVTPGIIAGFTSAGALTPTLAAASPTAVPSDTPPPPSDTPPPPTMTLQTLVHGQIMKLNQAAALRPNPDSTAESATPLAADTDLVILDGAPAYQAGGWWWHVRLSDNSVEGWVQQEFLEAVPTSTATTPVYNPEDVHPSVTPIPKLCGNFFCDPGETWLTCPSDCNPTPTTNLCGNFFCDPGENSFTCPSDCNPTATTSLCGNYFCDPGENSFTCPSDCQASNPPTSSSSSGSTSSGSLCGNFFCESGETSSNCPSDCS